MKEQNKKVLDKQLKKDRHLLFYAIVAFIVLTNIVYIIYSPSSTNTVTGITVESSSFNTDVESASKMSVLLDSGETVYVKIPGHDFFKNQTRVELSKSVSVMGKITYEFNDYQ
jgi:hypothetical protein